MSQVITNAFEQYWQSSLAAEQPVVLDEFILADIPNLDITSPIDPATGLPPESQIVHRQNVDQRGRINNNAVAYTIVMDTTVGDFSFNAMYLRNKANGVIGMIVYKGRETKLKTDQTTGQTGNSLVKSMLMGYDQAAEATLTNVDAGTWQIDYAARLRGQDEDLRQLASQLYGHHTFIGDGFKVVQQDGGHQVTQGVAIVGGLRIELKQPQVIYPGTKPIGVWVDVHRSGSLLSEHQNHFTIITSVADLADRVDSNGYQHFVAKLATVQADSTVIDGRGQGGSGGSGAIPDTFALWKRSMAEAGYDLIGEFGTKLTIETADQVLLSKDGKKVYAWLGALPKDVPSTATPENSGGIGPSLWMDQEQATLRGKLASHDGTSMVGTSKWRTQKQKNTDSVNPMDYGAIADGLLHPLSERYTTLADAQADYPHAMTLSDSIDWAAIQSALNTESTVFDFVGNVDYVVNKNLTRTRSIKINGDGVAHIHFVNSAIFTICGALVKLPNLASDISKTNNIISFSAPHGLTEDDVIIAYNPSDFSWSGHREYYHEGEYFKLYSVTEKTAKMYGLPADNYVASHMDMYMLDGPSVVINNMPITALSSPADSQSCIVVSLCKNVHITDARAAGGHSASIRIDRCYDVVIDGGSARNNSAVVTDEYGVSIWNSQKVFIKSGDLSATRHSVELGGTGFVCSVPTRDVFVDGCFLSNDTSNDNGGSSDMHGIVDRILYSNCTIYYGGLGGRNVEYDNCDIYSRESTADGVCLYGSEVVGGLYSLTDCTLITNGDLATYGAVSLAPSRPLRENLTLKIRNLTVKGGGGGELALMVRVNALAGETKKLDVDIRGVRCELSRARAVLYIRGGADGSAVVPSNGHIVDDITGPAGMYTIYPSGAALSGVPTREMAQYGNAIVTTSESDVVSTAPINFRYPYSKSPTAISSISSVSGSAQSKIDGVTPISMIFALSNTFIRPAISTVSLSTNFVAGREVKLHWQAAISDL